MRKIKRNPSRRYVQYLQMPYVTNDGNGPDERPCSADASIVPNEKKSCDRMNSEEIRNRYLYNLRCPTTLKTLYPYVAVPNFGLYRT